MIIKQGNNRIVTGRVTRDAEVKIVGDKQTPKCAFGVAAAKNGEDTIFANVVAWRDKAEADVAAIRGRPLRVDRPVPLPRAGPGQVDRKRLRR